MRNLIDLITEASKIFRVERSDYFNTTVMKNPTFQDLKSLISSSKERQLRGTVFGDVFVWDANDAIHSWVKHELGISETIGNDFWVIDEGSEPFSFDWETREGNPIRDGLRLVEGRDLRMTPGSEKLYRLFESRIGENNA